MSKDRSGRFVQESTPWNKGKNGVYSKSTLEKMSKSKQGKRLSIRTEFKKGHVAWNKGVKGLDLSGGNGWFEKGHKWEDTTENKRLQNLREMTLIKPNLNPTKNLAYALGAILGDGFVFKHSRSYRIGLDVTNQKFSTNFYDALKNIGLNPFKREVMPSNGIGKLKKYVVIANSKIFGEWYKRLSLAELEKFLVEEENILAFIKGFYESEGQIYKNKSGYITLHIHNTNLNLLKMVEHICRTVDLNFKLYGPYKNSGKLGKNQKLLYRLSMLSTNHCHKFLMLVNPSIKNLN